MRRLALHSTALLCTLAFSYTVEAQAPPSAVATAQTVYTLQVNLYEEVPGKCIATFPDKVKVQTDDIVIWEIKNACKTLDVELKFEAGNPLNKKCKLKENVEQSDMVLLICKVTRRPNTAEEEYKYSVKGPGFNFDPKLVVRPPAKLCDLCRSLCGPCGEK